MIADTAPDRWPSDRPSLDSLLFPAFDHCPRCRGGIDGRCVVDLVVFVCRVCGSFWHVELGVVYAVTAPPEVHRS